MEDRYAHTVYVTGPPMRDSKAYDRLCDAIDAAGFRYEGGSQEPEPIRPAPDEANGAAA